MIREVADWLEGERKKPRKSNLQAGHINFVRPGKTAKTEASQKKSILDGATGWNMAVDLRKKLVFPGIVQTNLRPT